MNRASARGVPGRLRPLALALALALLAAGACGSDRRQSAPAAEGGGGSGASDLLAGSRPGPGGAEAPLADSLAPGTLPPGPPLASSQQPPAAGQEPVIDIGTLGYDAGRDNAPVRVIEFSDFGCGFCRQFHMETYPKLVQEYIATGKVEWKYIPVVIGRFGPSAELAAEVGECAGEQGRFETVRDRIFELQGEWQRSSLPMDLFRGVAREAGLDLRRWEQCVSEGWREERVRAGTQLGFQSGLRGTPTFLIVGFTALPGALPIELFREVLDSALVVRSRGAGPGR